MAKFNSREAVCASVVSQLKTERKRLGVSMERLAEQAGLSTSMISLMERDLRNPTLDTLLRVADVLNINLGKILLQAIEESGKNR